jgi:hypothetical protein
MWFILLRMRDSKRTATFSHWDYTRAALAALQVPYPDSRFDLPQIAEQASRLDSSFRVRVGLAERLYRLFGRTRESDSAIELRQRCAYLSKEMPEFMGRLVAKGVVERVEIAPALIDDSDYSRRPNEDGQLYRLLPKDPSAVSS